MHPLVVETEELHSCPNCGSDRFQLWCNGRDRLLELSKQLFKYSRCRDCEVVFLSLRPRESEVSKFYPEYYGPYLSGEAPNSANEMPEHRMSTATSLLVRLLNSVDYQTSKLLRDDVAGALDRFYQRHHETGNKVLLDFGCGSDVFLNHARARGWETIGVDFSEKTVQSIAASGHKAFLMSAGIWNQIEDESLDCVRLSHVLEHLYAPREVLENIKRKMKSGATLHISMPNPESLTSKLFRSRWWGLECPRHVILYSPEVLQRLLVQIGFSTVEFRHEVITKDFVRSLGYFMFDQGWIRHAEVEEMTQLRVLESLCRIPARIASSLGMADRYHGFARK